ncbi:MAG: PilT/PilU family type 4a pilus ATPase [Campylobacterales bacterium]|nr:PilT/PilU family type 4a pilus ATPase [Campylobacterales bacterium]HEO98178.1 PilT/PilU family type 4a pilus ATPase [Campylobacterota bacterium]
MDAKKLLDNLLERMMGLGGSDLHIKSDTRPKSRISGEMEYLSEEVLDDDFFEGIIHKVLSEEQREILLKNKELDSHYISVNGERFRLNIFYHLRGFACVFRIIPTAIMGIDDLMLPQAVHRFVNFNKGMVLVTGTTGSGKSTTLAAIIDEINKTRKHHIITIEDPIEFVHRDKLCSIEQRDVGEHTQSFHRALRAALREDPDIILLGELRDIETIEIALHAANTGHLVFSTLHTLDARETIDRIVGTFPANEQNRISMSLASVLGGVICQRLVRKKDGKRCPAVEVMINTGRISQMIMEKKNHEIIDAIEEGEIHGMQSFDQSLFKLYSDGEITLDDALRAASRPDDLKLRISFLENSVEGSGYILKEEDETQEELHSAAREKHEEKPKLQIKR